MPPEGQHQVLTGCQSQGDRGIVNRSLDHRLLRRRPVFSLIRKEEERKKEERRKKERKKKEERKKEEASGKRKKEERRKTKKERRKKEKEKKVISTKKWLRLKGGSHLLREFQHHGPWLGREGGRAEKEKSRCFLGKSQQLTCFAFPLLASPTCLLGIRDD